MCVWMHTHRHTHMYTMLMYDLYYPQIVDLLSHPNEIISAEVLALLAAMLYAGNKNIQVWNYVNNIQMITLQVIFYRKVLAIY